MKCNIEIYNRVKRVNGQLQGVIKMMDEERNCEEILTQLSAIRSGVDKVISLIATYNLVNEIERNYNIEVKDLDKAVNLIVKNK